MKYLKTYPDRVVIGVYALLLLMGIWYGFPNLKLVADEAPFVGGVLRAMENKTLWPEIDYSYTVSFFANYLLMIPFVGAIFIIAGGTVNAISFLMEHVYLAYFIPRLVSAVSALFILYFFLKFMNKKGRDFYERVLLSTIIFGNIIFIAIAHTGKMWMLSLLLWFISFYLFDKALSLGDSRSIFWCVIFSFLAFANFPVNLIALIFPLWLWVEAFKKRVYPKALVWGSIWGLFVFGVLLFVNYAGWTMQNSVTPAEGGNLFGIIKYFVLGTLMLIPLHIIYALSTQRQPKDKVVWGLWFSLLAYILIVVIRAPWVGGSSPETYWRYFVYIGFILGLILATSPLRHRRFPLILATVSLVFALKTSYLLSVPSTHNLAREYLLTNSKNSLVVNMYPYLDLPKDQASYSVVDDSLCQSRCLYGRSDKSFDGKLFVIDLETKPSEFERIKSQEDEYILVSAEEKNYVGLDYDLGPYSWGLLTLDRLGPEFSIKRIP